jgi:hypothetical protein
MKRKSGVAPNPRPCCCAILLAGLLACSGSSGQSAANGVVEIDGGIWSLVTSGAALPWPEASEFCETLAAGGFSDWRLPRLAELESLHDPNAAGSIRGPFELEDCCAWSAENLTRIPPEQKGQLPDPGGPPEDYYWGFLFDGGISYYSNGRFADGFAMCTRDEASG